MPIHGSDEELMARYRLGDEAAFRALYERHSGRVFGYLRSKLASEAEARDVFQMTFLKLHRSRDRYDLTLPFVPWLFVICRSELLDWVRKKGRTLEVATEFIPEPAAAAGPVSLCGETTGDIDLTALNPIQRKVLLMRYQDEASFEEIAKALSTTPSNARQLVSRSLRLLRSFYGR